MKSWLTINNAKWFNGSTRRGIEQMQFVFECRIVVGGLMYRGNGDTVDEQCQWMNAVELQFALLFSFFLNFQISFRFNQFN